MLPMAVMCTNIMAILHGPVGGPATAVVLANAILGLAGFGVALLIGHLAQFREMSALPPKSDIAG